MQPLRLRLLPFNLPLKRPFTISRGTLTSQPTLIVELEQTGVRGYGEATANTYYGASIAEMTARLEALRPKIESFPFVEPDEFWEAFRADLADEPFPHCALDQAAHDLWGKLAGEPVWQRWGLSLDRLPLSNYTIGIDPLPLMQEKLREFADWPIFKIKLGTPHDLEIIRELRKLTAAPFRVDANCAWSPEETLRNAEALAALNVEFIEQPLVEGNAAYREIRDKIALPLMADESCRVEEDVERCAGAFHGVNIKLVKCGGLIPARRMIARAKELGLKTMVGCMTESTVGISAIAQLLPLLDYVDMDGAVLLASDIAEGVQVVRGRAVFPQTPGNGVTLRP